MTINYQKLWQQNFTKIEQIHAYETRRPNKSNYFLPRASKTAGQHKFEYRGVKLWNNISEELKNKSFNFFKKQFKLKILGEYRVTQKKRAPILIILNTRGPFFLGHPVLALSEVLSSIFNHVSVNLRFNYVIVILL